MTQQRPEQRSDLTPGQIERIKGIMAAMIKAATPRYWGRGNVADTPPANGQAYIWDDDVSEFRPATPSGTGAPSDADFLVGTSNASLSAEIVVGTSPGGELGGTWASPTVDSTHSGSAHHAEAHTIASHSDTTATGAELETLTDGSETTLHSHAGGSGDVSAAANMTDNAIVRGDGGAKGVQDSGILIDDSDNITGVTALTASGGIVTTAGNVAGVRILSTQATGTSPFQVASTTVVSNLNADLLDGQQGSHYLDSANFTGTNWTDLTDGGATTLHSHSGGSGHTIRENGTDQTARTGLNFIDTLAGTGLITDDSGGDETEVNLTLYLLADGSRTIGEALAQTEKAAAPADTAGEGQWWTKSNTPNQAMFTSDDGYDHALGNHFFALTLKDATTHATEKKAFGPFLGGPALQTTANWTCKAHSVDAVSSTNTFEVYRVREGSASLIATVTITSGNRFGSASSAFTLQDDDSLYVLHTGGDTSGSIYSIGFKRQ